jgi:MEMO1 family protein
MSLVFAAIAPHSPILVPSIGKDHLNQLKQTAQAYFKLQEELYASKAETLVVLSPHGPVHNSSFALNLAPEFHGTMEQFGDFATKNTYPGNVGLTYRIREYFETRAPLQLISEPLIDYGVYIPLFLLATPLPQLKIVPIYDSTLDLTEHHRFGKLLRHQLQLDHHRIAVIASADLSHRLKPNSPAGYSPKAEKFDNKLVELLSKGKTDDVLKIKDDLIKESGECGLKVIAMLLGMLDELTYEPKKLSYEAPFGVGYLTMRYNL